MVYKSQVKANVKYHNVLQKRKKNPKVQQTPVLYDHAVWFSLYGDDPDKPFDRKLVYKWSNEMA